MERPLTSCAFPARFFKHLARKSSDSEKISTFEIHDVIESNASCKVGPTQVSISKSHAVQSGPREVDLLQPVQR
jgi:hypothetical protein